MKYRNMDAWKVSVEFAAEIQRVVARMNGEARGVLGRGIAESALNVGSRLGAGASTYKLDELEKQVNLALADVAAVECRLETARSLGLLPTDESLDKKIVKLQCLLRRVVAKKD